MSTEHGRRAFLATGAAAAGGLLAGGAGAQDRPAGHAGHAGHGGGPVGGPNDRGKLTPGRRKAGEPPAPVEAPDLPKLKWEMKGGVKEFHLHAGHLKREFLPGIWFDVWGYNGSMPGPTIEAVEGDRVRIIVHNELPEPTSMHWHGLEVPIAMDGVPGLTQEPIMPGKSFTYEFDLRQNGTYFYHSHGAMQEGIGMAGLFVIHPKAAFEPAVDRDFALLIQEWAILPNATVPNTMSMEFNFFTLNGRAAPYMTPMVVRQGDRVRLRLVNMSPIDHHPMHLHGLTFWVTGTEAGRIPDTAWVPRNTVLVGVAQAADIEFVANNPGDWMLHCHMFHHMMNHMSSMAGPMTSHTRGPGAGGDMATGMGMPTRGGDALSPEYGPRLGRGTGENTGEDRALRNGPPPGMPGMPMGGHDAGGRTVPGFPQDMTMMGADMYTPEQVRKLRRPEARGMRKDWFTGVEGLMSVVRVLPPDLYDKVVSGNGEVPDGASVPGGGAGADPHGGHQMPAAPGGHGDHKK